MNAILALIVLGISIWAVLDIIKSPKESTKKILWIVAIIFLPVIGLILYLLLGRKKPAGA
ncbi:PLDc N-terminal domain-containing protein [Omnitrophica bacterium]|nr:PLDc N-terminal domain-containing protein [Candidatus Omnitrophota bacterium]